MRGRKAKCRSFARFSLAAGAILLVVSLLLAGTVVAQTQTPATAPQVRDVLPSYEGQPVVSVELAGRPDLDEKTLRPFLAQKQGEAFSQAKVDQTISALKNSGKVKEVELEIRPQANGIRILFICQPALDFGLFDFPGAAGKFTYSRLLQVSDYPPRGAYSAVDVGTSQASILKFLQQNGYFEAQVRPETSIDAAHGLVNVAFHVKLNRHAKFGKVFLAGAPPAQEPQLQKALKAWMTRIRGSAIRSGQSYSLKRTQNATLFLETQLINHNYLGSRVKLAAAEYDTKTNRADLRFEVTPGSLARVTVEGAHLWARTRKKLLPIYQIAGLDPELIQESRENLRSYFQAKGYFDVAVQSEIQPTQEPAQGVQGQSGQNIVFRIIKGGRHKVKDVSVAAGEQLPQDRLHEQVKVRKARFFSRGAFSERLVKTSADNLKRLYQAEGYSSATVTPEVKRDGGNISVAFRVNEGQQDIVSALQVVGNDTVSISSLAPRGLQITEGRPYSAKKVDDDRNQIGAQYLRMGYLNSNFRATAHPQGKDPHRLEVTYTIAEGPKVIVDSVVTLGAKNTRQSLIDKTVQLHSEAPLREDDLLAAEGRLYTLGIFDWAEIDPRRQVTTQTDEDVLVKLHESKRNDMRYGFGFEVVNRGGSIPSGTVALPGIPPTGLPSGFRTSQKTFWGPRGTFQYTHRNFRGLGESVTFAVLGARLIQRAGFSYVDPFFAGSFWNSNLTFSAERNSENPIFTSRTGDAGFQVEKMLNAVGTKTLSLRYGFRRTSLTNLLIPDLVPPDDRNLHLSSMAAAYSFDTRDNPLDATKGLYQTVDFDINLKGIGSSVNFARLRAQAAHYKEIGAGIVWANSLRVGVAIPLAGSRVPTSELFFSGGGSTLRGFPLNSAGPQRTVAVCSDPNDPSTCSKIQVPEGGRELLILNSEFRFPLPIRKGLGFVAFYDGGNVFPNVGFGGVGSAYTNTVGIGLRYKTPVGPVRVDIGHNFNAPPGVKATQIFITLGQAF